MGDPASHLKSNRNHTFSGERPPMSAAMLPNARVQFFDANGDPLVDGTVGYYEPGGTTPKTTWQDFDQETQNANPLTLDALGSAAVWGNGRYRQIVKDSLGNVKWDGETIIQVTRPYEAGFYWPGAPDPGTVIMSWNFTQSVIFPTNFVGSYGAVNSPPSGATDFDVKINGSSTIGTLSVSTGGLMTLSTIVSSPEFAPGDRLTVHVQAGGANSTAGISATFLGDLAS